jgi:hypothetical protein
MSTQKLRQVWFLAHLLASQNASKMKTARLAHEGFYKPPKPRKTKRGSMRQAAA